MSPWELPTSLTVGGVDYPIRTDFRDVLYVLQIFADPGYEQDERCAICLRVMYEGWESIPPERQQKALEQVIGFIDMGTTGPQSGTKKPRVVDWERDGPIIVPAVNKSLGMGVRGVRYLHWWTFLGAYMEIGESLFSTVLGIRQKLMKGKKLEKYEQEFYRANRALIDMRRRESPEEAARREALRELFV